MASMGNTMQNFTLIFTIIFFLLNNSGASSPLKLLADEIPSSDCLPRGLLMWIEMATPYLTGIVSLSRTYGK